MKILYLARFGQEKSNDDEGAIAHALSALGHDIVCVPEPTSRRGRIVNPITSEALRLKADFLLFHHYSDFNKLAEFRLPRVFWQFDLVTFPDPTLASRNAARVAWMLKAMPLVTVGFLTDGDYAHRYPEKLVWLPQGADERVMGAGTSKPIADILFTGIGKGGGRKRESFVAEMKAKYGRRFTHVERGVHGKAMADLIAGHKIIVAPDSPVTDRYTSNRIFNVLGFGGFLLHPWSHAFVLHYYSNGGGVIYYHSREELHQLIEEYLPLDRARRRIAETGLLRTAEANTYRHRCEKLIRVVQERLV